MRDGPAPFHLAFCWVHARRKFIEAESHDPVARQMIEKIGALDEIEERAREVSAEQRPALLACLRDTQSRPIVAEIKAWLESNGSPSPVSRGRVISGRLTGGASEARISRARAGVAA